MSSKVPGTSTDTGRESVEILLQPGGASHYAPDVVLAASTNEINEGDVLGQVTGTSLYCHLKKTNLATLVADPTLIDEIDVVDARGFAAGNIVDIMDSDGTTTNFGDKTILSVDVTSDPNTITFTAALGAATALAVTDYVVLATLDGAESAKRIALDHSEEGGDQVRGLISGLVRESLVSDNINSHGVLTELNATSLDGDVLSVG